MITRRSFLASSAAGALPPLATAAGRKPNIVILFADDLGWGELGCQGNPQIPTPNIDSIARNGVRFTNGYVSCPVCSPTRAGLMTGRYQQRFGHEFNPGPAREATGNFGLPLTETTLAERLKKAGYSTGMVGKWHLGYRPELHPLKRGFDSYFGFLGGAHSYLDANADSANPILRGVEPVPSIDYTTDEFTRQAVSFTSASKDRPFFLYLAYNAVHGPMHATPKYLSRFASIADERRRTFAAMLSALDDGVGQVLAELRRHNLENDTLIFFLSDNGGPTGVTSASNGPLRAVKGTVYEGGIRVPFLMQWKGRIPAGRTFDHPVIALDIHPTAAAAAGAPVSAQAKLDGVDLLPFVERDRGRAPHGSLFWRFGVQSAARMGDWKLVHESGGSPQLYNLARDTGEKNDLAKSEPDHLRRLQAAYDAWNAQLAEPKWRTGRSSGRRKKKAA